MTNEDHLQSDQCDQVDDQRGQVGGHRDVRKKARAEERGREPKDPRAGVCEWHEENGDEQQAEPPCPNRSAATDDVEVPRQTPECAKIRKRYDHDEQLEPALRRLAVVRNQQNQKGDRDQKDEGSERRQPRAHASDL